MFPVKMVKSARRV